MATHDLVPFEYFLTKGDPRCPKTTQDDLRRGELPYWGVLGRSWEVLGRSWGHVGLPCPPPPAIPWEDGPGLPPGKCPPAPCGSAARALSRSSSTAGLRSRAAGRSSSAPRPPCVGATAGARPKGDDDVRARAHARVYVHGSRHDYPESTRCSLLAARCSLLSTHSLSRLSSGLLTTHYSLLTTYCSLA